MGAVENIYRANCAVSSHLGLGNKVDSILHINIFQLAESIMTMLSLEYATDVTGITRISIVLNHKLYT